MIDKKEMIHCEVWRKEICDYEYEPGQTNIESGVVHCDLQHIAEFFNRIRGTKNKYVVISSRSDYGLCYQKHFPVYGDLHKAVQLFVTREHGYRNLTLQARLDKERCASTDLYSIKCYAFTDSTFNHIPDNVQHWFLTNNMVNDDPRIEGIPFGVNSVDGMKSVNSIFNLAKKIEEGKIKRDDWMYVNFQFYTPERLDLYVHYENFTNKDVSTCEHDIKYEDYLKRLASHKFCLCPNGNGVDCYRTWECLYLGCVPIIQLHPGTSYLADKNLPIVMSHSLFNIGKLNLRPLLTHVQTSDGISMEAAKLSYWKNKIDQKRELLCATLSSS